MFAIQGLFSGSFLSNRMKNTMSHEFSSLFVISIVRIDRMSSIGSACEYIRIVHFFSERVTYQHSITSDTLSFGQFEYIILPIAKYDGSCILHRTVRVHFLSFHLQLDVLHWNGCGILLISCFFFKFSFFGVPLNAIRYKAHSSSDCSNICTSSNEIESVVSPIFSPRSTTSSFAKSLEGGGFHQSFPDFASIPTVKGVYGDVIFWRVRVVSVFVFSELRGPQHVVLKDPPIAVFFL